MAIWPRGAGPVSPDLVAWQQALSLEQFRLKPVSCKSVPSGYAAYVCTSCRTYSECVVTSMFSSGWDFYDNGGCSVVVQSHTVLEDGALGYHSQ